MAVKKHKQKKQYKENLLTNIAVKLKCYHCDIKKTCIYRPRKEKDEAKGCITYCTITPNSIKKPKKHRKVYK